MSEILAADTDWESDAKASNVDGCFEEEEEEQQQQQLQASAKLNDRLQQVADYQPGDRLKKEHKYASFCWSSKRWTMK